MMARQTMKKNRRVTAPESVQLSFFHLHNQYYVQKNTKEMLLASLFIGVIEIDILYNSTS
jgi:hypothetical protein